MKRICFILLLLIFSSVCFAQQLSARNIVDEATKKESAKESVSYITENISKVSSTAEQRALYAFLGSLQEQMSLFEDAQKSYAKAASISAGDVSGMPKKSSEQLVLDAVRCALSAGDYTTADNYLNSSVRNSSDETIQSYIKLYSVWSQLSRGKVTKDLDDSIVMLKAYTSMNSMKSVKPQILLTLWYLTGDKSYSTSLKNDFPSSLETGIVKGEVQMLPAPFWYFLPRKEAVDVEIDTEEIIASGADKIINSSQTDKKVDTKSNSNRKLQLGLFREKANAEKLVETLKTKGFTAYITTEKRSSGTTYYIVVVDETDKTIGDKLRTAGFEFYPL